MITRQNGLKAKIFSTYILRLNYKIPDTFRKLNYTFKSSKNMESEKKFDRGLLIILKCCESGFKRGQFYLREVPVYTLSHPNWFRCLKLCVVMCFAQGL